MPAKDAPQKSSERRDGRRAILLYLDPDVIEALKVQALKKQTHAYLIVEELLKAHAED